MRPVRRAAAAAVYERYEWTSTKSFSMNIHLNSLSRPSSFAPMDVTQVLLKLRHTAEFQKRAAASLPLLSRHLQFPIPAGRHRVALEIA